MSTLTQKGDEELSGSALRDALVADGTRVSNVIVTEIVMTYRCGGHRLHMEGRQGRQTEGHWRVGTMEQAQRRLPLVTQWTDANLPLVKTIGCLSLDLGILGRVIVQRKACLRKEQSVTPARSRLLVLGCLRKYA